jgi:GntR family transcriptional regulator
MRTLQETLEANASLMVSTIREVPSDFLSRHSSRMPAIRRVREVIRSEILDERFPRSILPSEADLVVQHGVSRGVIREVLKLLQGEGLIERLQGSGTFIVGSTRTPQGLDVLQGLADELDHGSARLVWDLLDVEQVPATTLVAERLGVPPGDDVVCVERLTWFDGRPLLLRCSWLPLAVGAPLLLPDTRRVLSSHGAIEVIDKVLGCPVAYAERRIEATVADPTITAHLHVEPGHPILLLEQVLWGTDHRPLELSFSRVRGDRYVLTTLVRAPASAPATSPRCSPSTASAEADRGGAHFCRSSP